MSATESKVDWRGKCHHEEGFTVHEATRLVSCNKCALPIDPFDLLFQYAKKERNWRLWETEERETKKRISALKKEEARVKARTRSASRKDADAAVAAERKRVSEAARRTAWNARQIKELAEKIIRATGSPQ